MVADHKGREHQGGMNPSASLIAGGGPLLPSAPAAACPQLALRFIRRSAASYLLLKP
jgi:hypothetical protein